MALVCCIPGGPRRAVKAGGRFRTCVAAVGRGIPLGGGAFVYGKELVGLRVEGRVATSTLTSSSNVSPWIGSGGSWFGVAPWSPSKNPTQAQRTQRSNSERRSFLRQPHHRSRLRSPWSDPSSEKDNLAQSVQADDNCNTAYLRGGSSRRSIEWWEGLPV